MSIDEEQDNGTTVIDLRTSLRSHTPNNNSRVKFVRPCPYLSLDATQPDKIFSVKLDRETLCPHSNPCELRCHLYLEEKDRGERRDQIKLIEVKIHLHDIDDHRGTFTKRSYVYEIDETLPLGYRLQVEQVEDRDFFSSSATATTTTAVVDGMDGRGKTYHLDGIDDRFPFELQFDPHRHLLELILVKALDLGIERRSTYVVWLVAEDRGGRVVEDRCQLIINVVAKSHDDDGGGGDDDGPPEFEQSLYDFVIRRLNNDKFIGRVHIRSRLNTDREEKIFYRLISTHQQTGDIDHDDIFRINETTGELFLKAKNNNVLLRPLYELSVEAFNAQYLSSLTSVRVHFDGTSFAVAHGDYEGDGDGDDDEFLQIFVPKALQRPSTSDHRLTTTTIVLRENHRVPLTLLQLFLTSSSASLQLLTNTNTDREQQHLQLKQLDTQSFELIAVKSFDYEVLQNISVEFEVIDRPTSGKRKRKIIDILIEDDNDSPPHFDRSHFLFHLDENNVFPQLLHTFHAFDADQSDLLTYELRFFLASHSTENDNETFAVDATTGQFFVLRSLDRERQSNYSMNICVFDQIHRTCSSLVLHVLDQNDNTCIFTSSPASLHLTVVENLPSSSFLAHIEALDLDEGLNGTLVYSLSPPSPHLHLNSTTGLLLTTTLPFDAELSRNFSSSLVACDTPFSPSTTRCCRLPLHIDIVDQNDNWPVLIYPPASSRHEPFVVDYATNRTMPRLRARDDDVDLDHRAIHFSIVGGSLSSSLTIDGTSGQLSLHPLSPLPLFGTVRVSLSSQTEVEVTLLIHDNHTDPHRFLALVARPSSLHAFYLMSLKVFGLLLLVPTSLSVVYCFFMARRRSSSTVDRPLMNTPSSLSTRSLSNNNNSSINQNSKKVWDTYYSFGHTPGPDITLI